MGGALVEGRFAERKFEVEVCGRNVYRGRPADRKLAERNLVGGTLVEEGVWREG